MTDAPEPWHPADVGGQAKRHAPATVRNRDAIAAVLQDALPSKGIVLELASGSGEHVVHFANLFPSLSWQPSDPDPDALSSIAEWSREAGLSNILPPLPIDVRAEDWTIGQVDAILCINMVHISPWEATVGLMQGAGRLLPVQGLLYLYGPYVRPDVETAASNIAFDQSLRSRDPAWGLRNLDEVRQLASANGLFLDKLIDMPANNISVLFRKAG